MFVDTHCHINVMVQKNSDTILTKTELSSAQTIIQESVEHNVSTIINVGTNLIESKNCVTLATLYPTVYAVIGIHPNDLTETWKQDFNTLEKMLTQKSIDKIVGIGECGLDFHYPNYNKQRQYDALKAQIELALKHNLALVIHSRDAYEETLRFLEEFKHESLKGVIHCFSYDLAFAQQVIQWNYVLGIGGTITYPKNETLRSIVRSIDLRHIVLETDAPFLPPQIIRGKKNHPQYIVNIAEYVAALKNTSLSIIAEQTTANAKHLFSL